MASVAHVLDHAEDAFAQQTARNIRTVLQMKGIFAKDIASKIGLDSTIFSQRVSGKSRWLAREIRQLATELEVPTDVLLAEDERSFRTALAKTLLYKCESASDLPVSSRVALVSSRTRPDGRFRRSTDRPLMAALST